MRAVTLYRLSGLGLAGFNRLLRSFLRRDGGRFPQFRDRDLPGGRLPAIGGVVIAIGPVAAIVMTPLALVPSGPFRLDRIGVLAVSAAFAWCGWYLLRHATPRHLVGTRQRY